jgi:hypothetical protein
MYYNFLLLLLVHPSFNGFLYSSVWMSLAIVEFTTILLLSGFSMFARRNTILFILGALILAAVGVASTKAVFNYKTQNPGSSLTAGNLHHINSRGGSSLFTTSPLMKPGDTLSGTVVITNDGDLPGYFTVTGSSISDTPGPNGGNLSAAMTLLVQEGATTVYSGPLTGLSAQTLDGDTGTAGVQPLAVGSVHTYTVTATFTNNGTPSSNTTGDNIYRGSVTSFTLDWMENDR